MPNRMVREGILASDLVNKLTWAAEVFYRRLMSVADDFGRYDGRPEIVRAALYPLRLDKVSAADVDKWKAECAQAGLVSCYHVDGKEYIQIENFGQRLRVKKSKYPVPLTFDSRCAHLTADDNICGQLRQEEKKEYEEEEKGKGSLPPPPDDWDYYPKPDSPGELSEIEAGATVEFVFLLKKTRLAVDRIVEYWGAFKLNLTGKKFYQSRADLLQHFRNWLKDQKFDQPIEKQRDSQTSVADQIKAARAKTTC
jgi:hypothetical protein